MNVSCPHCQEVVALENCPTTRNFSCCLCGGGFVVESLPKIEGAGKTPFCTRELRDWYFPIGYLPPAFPVEVVTVGDGPFDEGDFDDFLKERGIQVFSMGSALEFLVIGRSNWDSYELDEHVEGLRGKSLRVYSQEMFLAYLGSGRDPYGDPDLLIEFGRGHPAFDHLLMWGFDWPTTNIVPGIGTSERGGFDWPQLGLLKHLGYVVGNKGKGANNRREILRRVFTEKVPNVQSAAYMEEWGDPGSVLRLSKLAKTIAAFARNAKRQASPPEEAIRDWEEDLAWLKATFYREGLFPWPATIRGSERRKQHR